MSDDSLRMTAFHDQVRRHHTRNAWANYGVEAAWGLAVSLIEVNAVLPVFLREMGVSASVISVLPALGVLGFTLPQLLSAYLTEGMPRKKYPYVILSYLANLPWLFIVLLVFGRAAERERWVVWAFFALYGVHAFMLGFITPMWGSFVYKLILPEKRGQFFGYTFFLHGAFGLLGALVVKFVLKGWPFPQNFGYCFLLSFIFLNVAISFYLPVIEPAYPEHRPERTPRKYVTHLVEVLRADRNYLMFILARLVLSLGGMATVFYSVYAVERFKLDSSAAGVFVGILTVSQMVSSLGFGRVGDRYGYKVVAVLSCVANLTAVLLALSAESICVFYGVFAAVGASLSSLYLAYTNLPMELCPYYDKSTYIGLANTLAAPFVAAGPLIGGVIATRFSYPLVFAVTGGVVLAGLIVLVVAVKEPRSVRLRRGA